MTVTSQGCKGLYTVRESPSSFDEPSNDLSSWQLQQIICLWQEYCIWHTSTVYNNAVSVVYDDYQNIAFSVKKTLQSRTDSATNKLSFV